MNRLKFISITFLFNMCFNLLGAIYYVAPNGNDIYPGTVNQPWATWQKAFKTAKAGDTVYFRGGIYKPTKSAYGNNITMIKPGAGIGNNGAFGKPICYFNYPNENPILDCSLIRPAGNFNTGLNIENAHFLNFRGLTIRNIYQYYSNVTAKGIMMYACSNFNFDQVKIHNVSGGAFMYLSGMGDNGIKFDSTRFINCDAYQCIDSLGASPGNMADGWKCDQEEGAYLLFESCRVWNCSDDGFDVSGQALTIFNNCWAIGCGNYMNGNGNGFKIGAIRNKINYPTRIVTNCLAAYNHGPTGAGAGFIEIDYEINDSAYYRVNARFYNNTAYGNDLGFTTGRENSIYKFRNSIYKNNIAYKSLKSQDGITYDVYIPNYEYIESHNTWDWFNDSWPPYFIYTDTVKVTDSDFISIDSSGISKPRNADGSLPNINFLKLSPTSDLIDAGTDVGKPFYGKAPDIGYNEYKPNSYVNVYSITVLGLGESKTISQKNGTLQLSALILPSDATNKGVKWTVFNDTGQATINNSGLVTALKDGKVRARATAIDGSNIFGEIVISIVNQDIKLINEITMIDYRRKIE